MRFILFFLCIFSGAALSQQANQIGRRSLPSCPPADLSKSRLEDQLRNHKNCYGDFYFPAADKNPNAGVGYRGEFDNGLPNGHGSISDRASGLTYEGQHKNMVLDGHGILRCPSGMPCSRDQKFIEYAGEFKNSKFHGQGTYTSRDGRYVGEFKDEKFDGNGSFKYANRDEYKGEWKAGNRNGQGTLITAGGEVYVGEWKADKKEGQGVLTYSDGRKYTGQFKNDSFNGQGVFAFKKGHGYRGEWKDGKPNGLGIETYDDGSAQNEGVFENGKFVRAEKINLPGQNEDATPNKFVTDVAAVTRYKEIIEEALNKKTDLVSAISVNAQYKQGFAFDACYSAAVSPDKAFGLSIAGFKESSLFKDWWVSLTDQQKSGYKSFPSLRKFASRKDLYDHVATTKDNRCLVIIDSAENIKFYLTSFESQNRLIKFGPSLSRDQALAALASAEKFENVKDMLIAAEFGTGVSADTFSNFKEYKVSTAEDFNKAVKRMKATKYSLEDSPAAYDVLQFLSDEDYAKTHKSTVLAVKKLREKNEQKEREARAKEEYDAFIKAKYRTVFSCRDQVKGQGIAKNLAGNLLREFVNGSNTYAYMLTSNGYSKFCTKNEVDINNYKIWQQSPRTTITSNRGTKGYLLEMDDAVFGVISWGEAR